MVLSNKPVGIGVAHPPIPIPMDLLAGGGYDRGALKNARRDKALVEATVPRRSLQW